MVVLQRLTSSARRFLAQAASSLPCTAALLAEAHGLELVSCAPSSVSDLATASARFWPEREVVLAAAALVGVAFDRELLLAVGRQRLACASIVGRNSSFTTKLSKSK
jgi:hypothetical protein